MQPVSTGDSPIAPPKKLPWYRKLGMQVLVALVLGIIVIEDLFLALYLAALAPVLGHADGIGEALVQFAKAYADQNESDHARFVEHRDRVLDERVDPDPVGVRRTLGAAHPPVVPGQHPDATVLA